MVHEVGLIGSIGTHDMIANSERKRIKQEGKEGSANCRGSAS